jgi:cyclohexa-1,5-dienecarbonyl-CoA hydratase
MVGSAQLTKDVQVDVRDGVAYVTLNAPPLNILTADLMLSLAEVVEHAQQDRSLRAIALTANGRAFSAGADVGEHHPDQAPVMIGAFSRLFEMLGASELPLVAAVDGAALGAGFELAIMADILVASERSTFGQPEIRLGFFAPVGVSWLSARVGVGRALEVTCTGRKFTAAEMAAMGVVSRVVPAEELETALEGVLDDLRRASGAVMRMNVRLTRQLHGRPFEQGRRAAEHVFLDELMATSDVREGITAFFEKRAPHWQHR